MKILTNYYLTRGVDGAWHVNRSVEFRPSKKYTFGLTSFDSPQQAYQYIDDEFGGREIEQEVELEEILKHAKGV